jgi:ACT domain-containing protein
MEGGIPVVTEGSRVVVTVIGQDRVGIIAGVSDVLAKCSVNILDISQTIMQEVFVMIMLVDMATADIDLITLQQRLEEKGQELGVKISALHEDVFRFMHRL